MSSRLPSLRHSGPCRRRRRRRRPLQPMKSRRPRGPRRPRVGSSRLTAADRPSSICSFGTRNSGLLGFESCTFCGLVAQRVYLSSLGERSAGCGLAAAGGPGVLRSRPSWRGRAPGPSVPGLFPLGQSDPGGPLFLQYCNRALWGVSSQVAGKSLGGGQPPVWCLQVASGFQCSWPRNRYSLAAVY